MIRIGKTKRTTNDIGTMSEATIATRFLHLGYLVSIPFGRDQRYDMIVEDPDGKLFRIQCKTARIDKGGTVLEFDTANHNINGKNRHMRNYRGQCDYFAVYSPDLDKVYLLLVDEVGIRKTKLRLLPSKNNQEKHVRWARDYEL